MRAWLVTIPFLSACGFPTLQREDSDGGHGISNLPPDAQQCFGSIVKVCFAQAADIPTSAPDLPTANSEEINTDSDPLCNAHANDQSASYCVVAGNNITIPSTQTIRWVGSKPLILLSTGAMEIAGTVDVGSTRNAAPQQANGAGANPTDECAAGTPPGGAGGGYGGSFGGRGGLGELIPSGSGAGAGGLPAEPLPTLPIKLRGGCAGGSGGNVGGTAGVGGSGGGAVALIASQLSFNGKINASGAGGKGGSANQVGGGGGGSGGMIVLDVDPAQIGGTGLVFANGGGGGQGGTPGNGHEGDDGVESTGPTVAAVGGANTGPGKDGGAGGAGSSGALVNGKPGGGYQNQGGGGGGGGGAGFVHAPTLAPANVAPPSKDPA